jgi:hypothetical protein
VVALLIGGVVVIPAKAGMTAAIVVQDALKFP